MAKSSKIDVIWISTLDYVRYIQMLLTCILAGFSIGGVIGFATAYRDELRYQRDLTIPRRAGTVPLPWELFGIIYGIGWGIFGAGVGGIVWAGIF